MSRLVSLLLILMFVLGPLWPHSHAGSDNLGAGQAGPGAHAQCVHVHLRAGHHHHGIGHRHQHEAERSVPDASDSPGLASSSQLPDHDADAIYIAVVKWAVPQSPFACGGVDVAAVPAEWAIHDAKQDQPILCRVGEPPERYSRLPAFLLQSALRV